MPHGIRLETPPRVEDAREPLYYLKVARNLGRMRSRALAGCISYQENGWRYRWTPKTCERLVAMGLLAEGIRDDLGQTWIPTDAGRKVARYFRAGDLE